jgi:hypothetical protein
MQCDRKRTTITATKSNIYTDLSSNVKIAYRGNDCLPQHLRHFSIPRLQMYEQPSKHPASRLAGSLHPHDRRSVSELGFGIRRSKR